MAETAWWHSLRSVAPRRLRAQWPAHQVPANGRLPAARPRDRRGAPRSGGGGGPARSASHDDDASVPAPGAGAAAGGRGPPGPGGTRLDVLVPPFRCSRSAAGRARGRRCHAPVLAGGVQGHHRPAPPGLTTPKEGLPRDMVRGMRFVELSHVIRDRMVTYPGLPGPEIGEYLTWEDSRARYAPG